MADKWPIHIKYSRKLRKNQTPEEKIIWEYLRDRRLNNYKFLRQHPILIPNASSLKQFYIADFYCAAKNW